jgi:hypothetical protein
MITLPCYQREVLIAWVYYVANANVRHSFQISAGFPLCQDGLIKGFEDLYSCKIAHNNSDMSKRFDLIFEDEKYASMFLLRWS